MRYGKNVFLYGSLWTPYAEALKRGGRRAHVLFIVRPHELGLENPAQVIRGPDGAERLWICDRDL